jgi:hypothetical protein
MLKLLRRMLCKHEYENLLFRRNGKQELSWDLRVAPQYDAVDRCVKCGKIVRGQYISLAD